MATRSNIAILNEDGTVTMVYCHWDGYPSNNGNLLQENYKTREDVDKLLSLGDMSSLGSNAGSTTYYHRDREENWKDVQPNRFPTEGSFLIDSGHRFEEWIYYFKNNKWSVGTYNGISNGVEGSESGFQDLKHVLSLEEVEE